MSDLFGHISCPDCDLEICIHDEGWHVDHAEAENTDFDELSKFVTDHAGTHAEEG